MSKKEKSYTEIRIPFSSAAFCDARAIPRSSNQQRPVTRNRARTPTSAGSSKPEIRVTSPTNSRSKERDPGSRWRRGISSERVASPTKDRYRERVASPTKDRYRERVASPNKDRYRERVASPTKDRYRERVASPRRDRSDERITSPRRGRSDDSLTSPRRGRSQEKFRRTSQGSEEEDFRGGASRKEKACPPSCGGASPQVCPAGCAPVAPSPVTCPPGCAPIQPTQESSARDRSTSLASYKSDKASVPQSQPRSVSLPFSRKSLGPPVDKRPPFIPAGLNERGRVAPKQPQTDYTGRLSTPRLGTSIPNAVPFSNPAGQNDTVTLRSCSCPSTTTASQEKPETQRPSYSKENPETQRSSYSEEKSETQRPSYSKEKRYSVKSRHSRESVESSGSRDQMKPSSRKGSNQSDSSQRSSGKRSTRLDEEDESPPEVVTSDPDVESPRTREKRRSRDSNSGRRTNEDEPRSRKKNKKKAEVYDADDESDNPDEQRRRRSSGKKTTETRVSDDEDEADEVNGAVSTKSVKKFLLSNPVFLNSFVEEHIDATTLHDWIQQKCCGNVDQARAYKEAKSRRRQEKREARARRASQAMENDEDENEDSDENIRGSNPQGLPPLNFKLDQIPGCPSQGIPREMTDDEIRRFRTLYGIDLRGGACNRGNFGTAQVCRAKFEMPSCGPSSAPASAMPTCGPAPTPPKPVGVKCPAFRQYQHTTQHFGGPECQCPKCRKKRC